jgi:ribosomal protein S18 acetylase RimI-like enzyme
MGVKVRSYRPEDRLGVIAVWDEAFPGGTGINEATRVIDTKLTVQPELFFVALKDGRVVGTAIAGFDGVRGWLHRLAVRGDCKRQGIASQLLKAVETGLRGIGCPKLNLQVRATNLGVLKFYEANGYVVENRASLGKRLV